MKPRLLLVLAITLVAALAFSSVAAAKPGTGSNGTRLSVPVTGTFTDVLGGVGTFAGQFAIDRFTTDGGELAVVGTLTGTMTDSVGTVLGTVTQRVTLPVSATATCDILELTLGPLDLDLLGLVVHLDQVHLEITAEQGPGNLLGNLLCAVAGLLDGGISLTIIADLLNVILDVLKELGLGLTAA